MAGGPVHDDHVSDPVTAWRFLRENLWWWLVPILIVLIAFGVVMALTDTGDVSPFVYD